MMLILASTSVYRRGLLERLGLYFSCVSPGVDETTIAMSANLLPREQAEWLAHQKAQAVAEKFPQATIIGCDQMAVIDGRILGKPGSVDAACGQLALLAGQTHELITALCVVHGSQAYHHTNVTRLTMRPLTSETIVRYVEAERPLDCAGAYKFESAGISLFERVESDDPTAIIGLPLMALTSILLDLGYRIP